MKEKETKYSKQEATAMLEQWADHFEVEELDPDVIEALRFAVMKERLSLDGDVFKYKLKTPVKMKDGKAVSIVYIQESDMGSKESMDRLKRDGDDIQRGQLMLAASLTIEGDTDGEMESIPLGLVRKIKDTDTTRIVAVIKGFLQ